LGLLGEGEQLAAWNLPVIGQTPDGFSELLFGHDRSP